MSRRIAMVRGLAAGALALWLQPTAGVAAQPAPAAVQPAGPQSPPGGKGCRLLVGPGGVLDVELKNRRILVPVTINGRPGRAILDTGASHSIIFGAAARRLGLRVVTAPGVTFYGAGGASEALVTLITFGFSGTTTPGLRIYVAGERDVDADMLLGEDLLSHFDLELDLVHGLVRIVQPAGCADDHMAYWADGYSEARMLDAGAGVGTGHVLVQVKLDGHPLRAILDTGAPASIATLAAARQAHVPLASGAAAGRMRGGGIGARSYAEQVAPVDSFEVGGEAIKATRLRFADLFAAATREETGSLLPRQVAGLDDMLLGYDFIASHHILISPSHHKVFFTYNGGPVFDTRAGGRAPSAPGSTPSPSAAPTPAPAASVGPHTGV